MGYVNITSILRISLHFEIHPLNTNIGYLLIYKFDSIPQLNSSINQIDGWTLLCPSNMTNDSIYTYFVDNQKTSGHQSIIFGLRELNSTETNNCSITNPPITNQKFNFTSNYELRIYTSGCYYLDKNNQWQSDGLTVGPLTNHYQTQCFSTHLTTFASGFIILPTPINWNYVFANADFIRNKTIYLTVISISIIYILLIIYARYKDKKDFEKLGVTPLPDNHKSDQYFYQIIVFTGHRKYSGTKSKVHFILSGDNNDTQVRTFADSDRKILQRNGVDAFVMAVPNSLGLLNYIRIWHDNTGQGALASWFLKHIIVRDLQTMEKFHFICQRWLAVEKDDGKIERVLFAANETEKQEFSYVLSKQTYHKISEDHLWFSIFSRPIANKFTRVQRCTCCFVLFFISMLLNIMYYDLSTETNINNINSLSFGPIYISSQQIIIGIIVELISLFPSLLIVQLFQRLRPRHNDKDLKKKKQSKLTFPWWCIFVAYGLSFLLIGLSIIFIISRGVEFGDLKTQKWLTSILTGFFSSILLTQPIKILCLIIFFALFTRKTNDEDDEEIDKYNFELSNNEEYLHSIKDKSNVIDRSPIRFDRLNEAEVACARDRRLKEIHMWSIIKEFFIYSSFLIVLCILTYSNRDQNAFLQVNHLRNFFLNTRQIDNDYTKILTINEYWNWLENSFVQNIRAQQWYNGQIPRNLSGFINDKSNRLIGWATMRQLRIKSNFCHIQKIKEYCKNDDEGEKRSFQPGWINETNEISNSSIDQAFKYRSSEELDTYIYIGDHGSYNGGGYLYEFRGRLSDLQNNLSKLHQLEWIDNRTQAVIIQINLYNPNSQLFTSVTLLSEFLSTGGIISQARFEPFYFYLAFTSIFQLVCGILYIGFIFYFVFHEIQSLFHLKLIYFRQFWSYVEFGIIVCSLTSIAVFIWKYKEMKRIGNLFEKTNGYVYINLQIAVYINDILTFLFGFCCFFGTIKFVRLCRFNKRLLLFTQTLKYSFKELISFGMMFSIVFIAFVTLFYFLFISKISSCATLSKTAQMLFEMALMKFNTNEFIQASAFLGPFCFSLFILLVVFVCLSMFITIINDSFRRARENVHDDDPQIFSYMFNKFSRSIGVTKPIKIEIQQEHDAPMRPIYIDPIETFPKKSDQLLNALN